MSIVADTRKFSDSFIRVRNEADDGWERFLDPKNFAMPGVEAAILDASTARGENYRVGLPEPGEATFDVFDNMDNAFLDRLNDLYTLGTAETFQFVMPEGTNRMKEFTAQVLSQPADGGWNGLWNGKVALSVTGESAWAAYTEEGDEDA